MAKLTLQEQAEKVLQEAEAAGLKQNFFFRTTFQRYITQMNMLQQLEEALKGDGVIVTKAYVKGRENIYTNPAVNSYNATTTAANQTVKTLIAILDAFKGEGENHSKLQAFIDKINE